MEAELVSYAQQALAQNGDALNKTVDDSIISIEDRITTFDGQAARQTFLYVSEGIRELGKEMVGSSLLPCACGEDEVSSDDEDGENGGAEMASDRRDQWWLQQLSFGNSLDDYPTETTPLVI